MGFSGKGSKNAGKTGLNPCAFLRMRFYGMKTADKEKSVLVKCRDLRRLKGIQFGNLPFSKKRSLEIERITIFRLCDNGLIVFEKILLGTLLYLLICWAIESCET
jgi:hypothetical protein